MRTVKLDHFPKSLSRLYTPFGCNSEVITAATFNQFPAQKSPPSTNRRRPRGAELNNDARSGTLGLQKEEVRRKGVHKTSGKVHIYVWTFIKEWDMPAFSPTPLFYKNMPMESQNNVWQRQCAHGVPKRHSKGWAQVKDGRFVYIYIFIVCRNINMKIVIRVYNVMMLYFMRSLHPVGALIYFLMRLEFLDGSIPGSRSVGGKESQEKIQP